MAIRDIANVARANLQEARSLREDLLQEEDGDKAVAVLIPGLASETFLDRLDEAGYDLTDANLRNVGFVEHVFKKKNDNERAHLLVGFSFFFFGSSSFFSWCGIS
jgi:uncharacterized protein YjbI with pentapeptide repeats